LPEDGLHFEATAAVGAFALEAAFTVAAGKTLALVGPNGAGKSTCLGLIAGLISPRTARITCAGEVWTDTARGVSVAPERRRVGVVFQDYALFPHLSVERNVAYGPRARRMPDAAGATARALERLRLSALRQRSVSTLSGGERQRVALARALAADPAALLLDEPFAALDVGARRAVRSELMGVLAECGLPAVLVTHDPVDALAFGHHIAVLEAGRVTQAGSREELLSEPRSAFVADLAGLNLFRAEIAEGAGLKEARAGAVTFHVLADDRRGPGFVAFAPADVTLSAERLPGSAQNAFAGTMVEVLPLPDRLRVTLDAGALIVAEITREGGARLGLEPGRRLWASVKATAIRVYG
jgi:molybdate transport system ATP-binding protein